jgi:hypothetical protein
VLDSGQWNQLRENRANGDRSRSQLVGETRGEWNGGKSKDKVAMEARVFQVFMTEGVIISAMRLDAGVSAQIRQF